MERTFRERGNRSSTLDGGGGRDVYSKIVPRNEIKPAAADITDAINVQFRIPYARLLESRTQFGPTTPRVCRGVEFRSAAGPTFQTEIRPPNVAATLAY